MKAIFPGIPNTTGCATDLVRIPARFLAEIADDSDRIPRLYFASNPILRRMFWERLHVLNRMLNRHIQQNETCIDFGGGSGVLLPTLAAKFAKLTLVDLETEQATLVRDRYGLKNVIIKKGDIAQVDLGSDFDAAIAADVLEHFQDLEIPVKALRQWLKRGGLLFTSLPTENSLYTGLRKVFGIEKPWDHYHAAFAVEDFLARNGFERVATKRVPWSIPLVPLFLVTTWRKS